MLGDKSILWKMLIIILKKKFESSCLSELKNALQNLSNWIFIRLGIRT
jgi:hypothetical protein